MNGCFVTITLIHIYNLNFAFADGGHSCELKNLNHMQTLAIIGNKIFFDLRL